MKQYKAIFLDWDDTVGDFKNAAIRSLQDIYANYDLSCFYPTFEQYYEVYHPHNVELWERYGRSEVTKDELQHDRFYYPLKTSPTPSKGGELDGGKVTPCPSGRGLGGKVLHDLADAIGNDFVRLTTAYFSLLPDAAEVVHYLASRYPLTIVSNGFIEVQYEKIRRSGLQHCFRHVVLSEEVGVQKPNPLIYQKALELNQLEAADVLMIGDSWSSDIQGAINAGIDQLWIQSPSLTDEQKALPATYKINNIRELLTML